MFGNLWQKLKDWTGWSEAGSIFLYRLEAITSFIAAVAIGMDWTALMAMDFSKGLNKSVLIPCALLFGKALLSEYVRRSGSKDFV